MIKHKVKLDKLVEYQTRITALTRTVIRARDIALHGSVNAVLERFGAASEARQYSGRAVADDWQCPFTSRESANA